MHPNDEQIIRDLQTMAGQPPRVPGARRSDPVPKVSRFKGWWRKHPSTQVLLIGFFIVVLLVAGRVVEWWWAVMYQLGAWFLAQAREKNAGR